MKKPILLAILDGFGLSNEIENNAIKLANTPNLDNYFNNYPTTQINASGLSVGLPEGQMGNSEVGHTNIGAGRVVYQHLTKISKEIKEDNYYKNENILKAINNCKKYNSKFHILGLLSNGGVHSHIDHIKATITLCKNEGLRDVYLHAIMDGRDTNQLSGKGFMEDLSQFMEKAGVGIIASINGRYFAMDRDNRWDRVEKAYNAIIQKGGNVYDYPVVYMQEMYGSGKTDEFIEPSYSSKVEQIKDNDSIFCINFRPDRAREITRVFVDDKFSEFSRQKLDVLYLSMTSYFDEDYKNLHIAYGKDEIKNTLGEYLSNNNLKQLRIAETEKYAHVTFFFNAGVEEANINEDRLLVNSPDVATYDLKPEMSADELTAKLLMEIDKEIYDVIILNYANCDMVGHTGVLNSAVKAVETIDKLIKNVVDKINEKNGVIIITADHGNADKMFDENGVFTAHTTNKVPFCVIGCNDIQLDKNGSLCDIAPTMLDIMNLDKPREMLGKSLII